MKIPRQLTVIFQYLVYFSLNWPLRWFAHLEVTGSEKLDGLAGPYILAPNHTSKLDPFLVLVVFFKKTARKPIYCVTKDKKFYDHLKWERIFCREPVFNLLGGYQAFSGKGNYQDSLSSHIKFLNEGFSTCIFPEGRISPEGKPGEAKGGVMFLSQVTGAPVIPLAITGISQINFGQFIFKKRRVKVTICQPIRARQVIDKVEPTNFPLYEQHSQIILQTISKNL